MKRNIISADDAGSLLTKLLEERIRVHALFISASGSRATLDGFVGSIDEELGVTISERPPSSGAGYFSVPIFNRPFESAYGDKRELPEASRESLAKDFGESMLAFWFEDGEFFVLTFTL
jgi:hypothetical protein